MNIKKLIKERPLFFDGAMGTMLQSAGLLPWELPELVNIKKPEMVFGIHEQYLRAGCDIIKTNTFGANRFKAEGSGYTVSEMVEGALLVAQAAAKAHTGKKPLIALDIGPTGKLLAPIGTLSFEDAVCAFAEVVDAGARGGADLILIETMSDTYELKAAVLAAKENCGLPVFATVTPDEGGRLLTGADILAALVLLEGLGVDAAGLNCGFGPRQTAKLSAELIARSSLPVIISPNAGLPKTEGGRTYFDAGPAEFAKEMRKIALSGAHILGGCCGTTPEHIERMISELEGFAPKEPNEKGGTFVSSYSKAVEIGAAPVIIGERINPTGKKRFKEALKQSDFGYVIGEGLKQKDAGAHILDVNVGLPGLDESAMMERAVLELQAVLDLPLQIDSASPAAIERALRVYNGKALINSVNGKAEVMEAVFPIVKKYGGVVVGLTLDENGIPEGAEGRLEIAERIVKTAKKYGIKKKDIIIDPLTMAISAGEGAAGATLGALGMIGKKLGVATILGVSNISFGLPERDGVNAAFLTMALYKGLGAAIINPLSAEMMRAFYAYLAISGRDSGCAAYIGRFGGEKEPEGKAGEAGLYEIVLRGIKDSGYDAARGLLENKKPMEVIDNILIPALDEVGKGFEEGRIYLPQLIMSAQAAQRAFEAIKDYMRGNSMKPEKRGGIILATVEGDVHDIGKNIVKVLLENYGYEILDLGKNVPPSLIVQSAAENKIKLVGLSALMTTTVPSMEKTIKLLREADLGVSVMVGGAVLTEEYAKVIGADFYASDATAAVSYAKKIFKG